MYHHEDASFYNNNDNTDEGGGTADSGSGRGRKLRKKKKKRGGVGGGSRRSSSGGGFFGGGTSSIMSELSVGDIVMMEAGIRREASFSTKEAGGGGHGSRRQRRRRDRDRGQSDSDDMNDGSRRGRGPKSNRASLPLPPTLPEVWRMSSGLLSVVSFQSLFNSFSSNLLLGGNNGPPHPRDSSKEIHERTSTGGGGPHSRPGHRRQTSNAWVDEDAIHGPTVGTAANNKGKGKKNSSGLLASPVSGRRKGGFWRRNLRESWPLRTMISPTLPKLSSPWGSPKMFGSPKPGRDGRTLSESSTMRSTSGTLNSFYAHQGGGGYHHDGVASSFRFPNDVPSLLPPRHHHGDDDCLSYSPPRQLPKPPRQALLAASVESAGDSPLGNGFYRGSNWTTGARTMTMANMATPSRSGSNRSVAGSHSSERGLLHYYKYEEMDNKTNPVVLTNPYHHPVAMAGGTNSGGGGFGIAITTSNDSVVPAPLRLSSADSTLSGILRDTEKRLQDGTVTGVVARRSQRGSISPSKRALVRTASGGPLRPRSASITSSAAGGGGGGGNEHIATLMITSAGAVHAAPPSAQPSPASSPSRAAPPHHSRASGHIRQDSQASVDSEADSLFAAPSPMQDHFHPLTSPVKNGGMGFSPSGPPPQHPVPPLPLARHNSFTGSVSSSGSSLPTIYSVDENADGEGDDTRITAFGSSTSEGLNRLAGFVTSKSSSNTLDDPFVVNRPAGTRTTPSPTKPSSGGRSVAEFGQQCPPSLWSQSPLEAISGNSSRAIDPQARRSEPLFRSLVLLAAGPTSNFGTTEGKRRLDDHENTTKLAITGDDSEPNLVVHSSTIPNILVTTPSERADDSPLAKPAGTLCTQASSPTLGQGREQTPEVAPPSPALSKQLSNVYDYYMNTPSSDGHGFSGHRRAAGEVRKMSEASSAADARDFERNKNMALEELNKLIKSEPVEGRSVRPVSTPAMGTASGSNSARMVPPEWLSQHGRGQHQHKQPSLIPVSTTVAQLRRMNSQVSSYSNAASGYSDGSSSAPFLPPVIEGATPIVSPPRNRRDSARNYLAVGSPVHDKENKTGHAPGSRIPRPDVAAERGYLGVESQAPSTPRKKRPTRHQRAASSGGARASEDSLGLYDGDGFWISPERASRSNGFRM